MKYVAIPQSSDSARDLIYPLETKAQIDEALIAMRERGIEQLRVFATSLSPDEFDSVNDSDSYATGDFLIGVI